MRRFRKFKLNNRGESLVETLVALLVIVLAVLLLASGIMASSRANEKTANTELYSSRQKDEQTATGIVVEVEGYGTDRLDDVKVYCDLNSEGTDGYYFYEFEETTDEADEEDTEDSENTDE